MDVDCRYTSRPTSINMHYAISKKPILEMLKWRRHIHTSSIKSSQYFQHLFLAFHPSSLTVFFFFHCTTVSSVANWVDQKPCWHSHVKVRNAIDSNIIFQVQFICICIKCYGRFVFLKVVFRCSGLASSFVIWQFFFLIYTNIPDIFYIKFILCLWYFLLIAKLQSQFYMLDKDLLTIEYTLVLSFLQFYFSLSLFLSLEK